jgi:osmotically-inducible protein OsmY
MQKLKFLMVAILSTGGLGLAADPPVETFHAYVDSDICAHLMLGPINAPRINCSQKTAKDGAEPVLVRMQDNLLLAVNKQKLISKIVGQFAQATGEVKAKDGTMKLESVKPEEAGDIPKGDPARLLIDARQARGDKSAKLFEKIRHELAMMPYISEFDFISFTLNDDDVILSGWTVRQTNRSEAFNRVKSIEGVDKIVNNIDILPLGRMDMQVRAGVRAQLQRMLGRYFWASGSDIKIIVKNGDVILLGNVANKTDSDIANIQANQVQGAFHVFNLLQIVEPAKKENKG